MADPERKSFMVEDAKITWRNFAGREGMYNVEGQRNFNVIITDELAEQLEADDWNVKYPKPDEEDGTIGPPFVPVTVRFDIRPPRIVMITTRGRTPLDESTVEILDWADIETVDLICTGYEWAVNGKTGIKAYLKSLFVTISEDALERKYAINDPEA